MSSTIYHLPSAIYHHTKLGTCQMQDCMRIDHARARAASRQSTDGPCSPAGCQRGAWLKPMTDELINSKNLGLLPTADGSREPVTTAQAVPVGEPVGAGGQDHATTSVAQPERQTVPDVSTTGVGILPRSEMCSSPFEEGRRMGINWPDGLPEQPSPSSTAKEDVGDAWSKNGVVRDDWSKKYTDAGGQPWRYWFDGHVWIAVGKKRKGGPKTRSGIRDLATFLGGDDAKAAHQEVLKYRALAMAKKAQQKGPAYEVTSSFSHTTQEERGGQSLPAPNNEQEEQRAEALLDLAGEYDGPHLENGYEAYHANNPGANHGQDTDQIGGKPIDGIPPWERDPVYRFATDTNASLANVHLHGAGLGDRKRPLEDDGSNDAWGKETHPPSSPPAKIKKQ